MLHFIRVCNRPSASPEEASHKYLVLDLDLDRHSTRRGFMERLKSKLDHELGKQQKAIDFLKKSWDFLSRIKVLDSGLDNARKEAAHDEIYFDELAHAFHDICEKICGDSEEGIFRVRYDGIIILIDEADNCSNAFGIGEFFKLFLEKLQRLGCNKICVGLVGLPHLREKLSESHPSSVRIFRQMPIEPLGNEDVRRIIYQCIDETKKKGDVANITEEAVASLVALSEGFPHFLHQFGYCAFNYCLGETVEVSHVELSAFGPNGALSIIGDSYYRVDFFEKIQGEAYRQVLRIMSIRLDDWVTKEEIRKEFNGKPATLNNALLALRDRRIILAKQEKKGVYKLQNKGFAVWIRMLSKQIGDSPK